MIGIIERAEAALEAVKLTGNDPVGSVGLINALLVALREAREQRRHELISFCQFISYQGGEATLLVNGLGIKQEQAVTLVSAYLNLRAEGK